MVHTKSLLPSNWNSGLLKNIIACLLFLSATSESTTQPNCFLLKTKEPQLEFISLETGKTYRFKAEIDYQKKAKFLSVKYYLDDKFILHHYDVPLLTKKTDGPYGPTKPYIKIGIYRIGDTGTTTFTYDNFLIKNKKM